MNRKSLPAKNIDQYEELYPTFIDGQLHHFCYKHGEFADGEPLYHFVDLESEPELFRKFVRLYFQRNRVCVGDTVYFHVNGNIASDKVVYISDNVIEGVMYDLTHVDFINIIKYRTKQLTP